MKKRKIYIIILVFMTVTCGIQAQTNDALTREMTIEKDFTPIVRDASKINVLPEVEAPKVNKTTIQYVDWLVPVTIVPQLQTLPAAEFGTSFPYKVKNGYADLSMGNYLNASASAGYRFLDTEKDRLNIWFRHFSTHGKVKYLEKELVEAYGLNKKASPKRSDNLLNVSYQHRFDRLVWSLGGNYRYNLFNYYGMPLSPAFYGAMKDNLQGYGRNQIVNQWDVYSAIESQDKNNELKYRITAGFGRYANRLGALCTYPGSAENNLFAKVELVAPIDENNAIGIDGKVDYLFYTHAPLIDNYAMVTLNPYYNMENDRIKFRLGVNADFSANDGTVVRFAPDIYFRWMFVDNFFLYSNLTGGKKLHTFTSLAKENIYFNPSQKPSGSYTPADWTLGFRSNFFKSFTFDLFGGIKTVTSALFDYQAFEGYDYDGTVTLSGENTFFTDMSRSTISYQGIDAVNWNAGVKLEYRYFDILNASLQWKHNYWRQRKDGKAQIWSGRPVDELDLSLGLKTSDHLSFLLDYFMATGRRYNTISRITMPATGNSEIQQAPYETSLEVAQGKLRNIHNVNIGATYRFNDYVHVRVQFNNILNRSYNLYYGMPAQRFNFMAGAGINF
ncbi:hypothetical protein [Coprobacter tertius]|uniref:TonB-dependent receptor n=1 Tax=Coprobacter tertius TaxID=2944915 RepID=A0ABT1MD05_9BACT|nr:hypothetical protein [Coprobacter tertius]MCP9610500.1 hypothetical protein [Coprobacter tertius]